MRAEPTQVFPGLYATQETKPEAVVVVAPREAAGIGEGGESSADKDDVLDAVDDGDSLAGSVGSRM